MDTIRNKALYLLARRDHSRRELFQKLVLKSFSAIEINKTLDMLEDDGLLNEDRFIASVIRSRRAKGFGPLKICAELTKHGINHDRINLSDEWQEIKWQEGAISARIKRFGEAIPVEPMQRVQQAKFLQQRGFTHDQIRYALKR
ncbi:MAG: regulatory protein RecX [Proteobacteria bacterium]|nr:regulatory protein RecX [Pseudomonadota bacterium]